MWKLSVLEADQGEKIDTGCLSWLTTMRPRGGGGGEGILYIKDGSGCRKF